MKTIILKVAPLLTLALVGCIAQAGSGDEQTASSSSAALEAPAAPNNGAAQTRGTQQAEQEHSSELPNITQTKTPSTGAPTNPQDNGDGQDPEPHPWEPHMTTATTSH